jgi:hypothetical protein
MSAFVFQPQNIVANPNVLFYKADTTKHREKLKTIFPYVLGAITAETLAQRHELQQIQRDLRRKEQDLASIRTVAERWRATVQARVSEARELGLLAKDTPTPESHQAGLDLLRQVAAIQRPELTITTGTLQAGVDELNGLASEEATVAQELSLLRRRFSEMEQLRTSSTQYKEAIGVQRDRLQLSRWLRDQAAERACPICGNQIQVPTEQLKTLLSSLESLEETTAQIDAIPPSFDRELERVRSLVTEQTERLRGIRIRRAALEQHSASAERQQYSVLAASRFLGRIETDLKMLESVGQDGDLQAEVDALRARATLLQQAISEAQVFARMRRALDRVNANAGRILPMLDAERPNDPVSLLDTELTIKVVGPDRDDFLWEIGSGSNWLSYHVAVSLALQQSFLEIRDCPVPSFLVYDQPSQVYFPRRLAERPDDVPEEPEWRDQDVEAVQKILRGMASVVAEAKNRLQIIVLDHAADSVWGSLPLVHKVEDWRDGRALIPQSWIG